MIRVVVGQLATSQVTAIVRPSTERLDPATTHPGLNEGAAADFHRTSRENALDVGAAIVTGAGTLAAQFLIHAVVKREHDDATPSGWVRALGSALQRAIDWEIGSIALPPMDPDTGVTETTARIMSQALITHLEENAFPTDVTIVVATDDQRDLYRPFLPKESF